MKIYNKVYYMKPITVFNKNYKDNIYSEDVNFKIEVEYNIRKDGTSKVKSLFKVNEVDIPGFNIFEFEDDKGHLYSLIPDYLDGLINEKEIVTDAHIEVKEFFRDWQW